MNRGRNPGYNPTRNASAIGVKHKDIIGIPWLVAFAMREAGWYWRATLPWIKRASMPDSATDRPGQAVEYFILFSKRERYFYDHVAVMRKGSGLSGGASFGKQNHDTEGTKVAARKLESAAERSEVEGMRNFRNSDLFFSSMETPPFGLVSDENGLPLALDVNPKSFHGSHFAVFPELLIEPLLLASTSAAGCCSECGEPWSRVVEKIPGEPDSHHGSSFKTGKTGAVHANRGQGDRYTTVPIGWEPGCECGAGVVPCTILDPFGGSGTSLAVAKKYGRRGIACELNPDYVPLMQARLAGAKARAEKVCAGQNSFL